MDCGVFPNVYRLATVRVPVSKFLSLLIKQVSLTLDRHLRANCSGQPFRVNLSLELELAGTATATLASEPVTVARVILTDQSTGEIVKQIIYFDDRQTPIRLHHGVFADDGGPLDAEGYPLVLHEVFLERQP